MRTQFQISGIYFHIKYFNKTAMKKIILIPLTVLVSLLIFSACEENEPIAEEPEYEVLATYENQVATLYPDCERSLDSSIVWSYIQIAPIEGAELYSIRNHSYEIDNFLKEWGVITPTRKSLKYTIPIKFDGELRSNNTNQSIYINSLSLSNICECGEVVGQVTDIEGRISKGIEVGSNLSYYFMDVPDLPINQKLPKVGSLSNPDLANFGGRICNVPDSIKSKIINEEVIEVLFSGNYSSACYSYHTPCYLILGIPYYNLTFDI